MNDAWSPAVYGRFGDERSRPFYDLAALVRGPVGRVVDLGCGPGNLTAELPRLVGATEVLGIDNSPAYMRRCCEESLVRLDVDTIDLYYVHRTDPNMPIEWSLVLNGASA